MSLLEEDKHFVQRSCSRQCVLLLGRFAAVLGLGGVTSLKPMRIEFSYVPTKLVLAAKGEY